MPLFLRFYGKITEVRITIPDQTVLTTSSFPQQPPSPRLQKTVIKDPIFPQLAIVGSSASTLERRKSKRWRARNILVLQFSCVLQNQEDYLASKTLPTLCHV